MSHLKTFPKLLKIYLLSVSIFFLFRLCLFVLEFEKVHFQEETILTILHAFLIGVRFDIVVTGYILLIPAVILLFMEIIGKSSKIVDTVIFYWIFILFSLSFLISSIDIPYFMQFFSRFSVSAFEWIDNTGFIISMISEVPEYMLISIPLILLFISFYKLLHKIIFDNSEITEGHYLLKISLSVLILALMILGTRGRIQEKSPIRVGTAYFSNNSFLNQLGLNPVFTLGNSYLKSTEKDSNEIHLLDNQSAIRFVQKELGIDNPIYNSPIARYVHTDTTQIIKPNIILIIMESMSAAKMTRHGNTKNLTPFLDSISHESYYFDNIYTAGKHTYNGIFSSLFSFPALYRQQTLKVIKKFNGMSSTLRKNGYSTTYFTTHDSQFDNVEGFLRENEFENIISQSDYPLSEIKTTLGVPDDYMFEFSIPILDRLASEDKPFFATFMTSSDHRPYYIPDYFKPHNVKPQDQIVEYADWSLHKFINLASEKDWFQNTIFVFVADHGLPIHTPYSISLDYHHSPLIIYAPHIIAEPNSFDCIGGQIDLFPTVMGITQLPYINNTLGVDLIHEQRKYICINDDDKVGLLDNEYFLIMEEKEKSKLYKYKNSDKTNYAEQYPKKVLEMETYLKSNLQVFQYMLKQKQQFIDDTL